ncbi:hypothetical protein [Rhodocyclus tenuis]|uniref:hypothetical protein n=1 Tax=Rhodocyclus tenuis TaxID=1066 RepID=UPI001903F7F8|nr:hypothetical protein [Rhodocyclus tenuis]MBK1679631.1 hypothetical protein [Rhodocyclus tenuis]
MGQNARGISDKEKTALWEVFKGPLTLILYGIAGVIVVLAIKATGLFQDVAGFLTFGKSAERIATLVFLVGLGFAAFLWWLCARYFQLLREANPGENLLSSLKDLPMALPEGTVRAIIALIIGVVGLPLLVFSKELGLSDAIAGYVNGIIIGVFSYYFGTRANAGDAQTTRQTVKMLDTAQATNATLEQKVNELNGEVEQVDGLKTSLQASDFDRQTTRLQEQLTQAEVLIDVLGPALPKGLIPDGAGDALKTAQQVLETARKLKAGEITGETVTQVASAAETLIGKSPLTALLKTAAGAMPALANLTPAAGVALLLGVAWRLGSDQYRRWVARVLDAPYDPQLISLGLITPTSAEIALKDCPIFKKAFADRLQQPAFISDLLDAVLRDDAADRLWAAYGAKSECFASRGELEQGLNEFRGALLWDQSASDISQTQIREAQAVLAGTPLAGGEPAPEQVNAALREIATNSNASDEQRSALQALVLLVGSLRQAKLDPLKLIAEGWK